MNHELRLVSFDKLAEELLRPEKELHPLLLFRGITPVAMRRHYNFAYAMFLAQAPTVWDSTKLSKNHHLTHLCGFHSAVNRGSVLTMFQRLRGCPEVTNRITGFTEYVEWVNPDPCYLHRVPKTGRCDAAHKLPYWRMPEKSGPRMWRPPANEMHVCYPFCGTSDSGSLVSRVHAMVPKGIPHEIRGDLCQDLLVAVLSGDLTIENVPDAVAKHLRQARKFLPASSRILSLDAPLFGDTDRTMHDTVGGW